MLLHPLVKFHCKKEYSFNEEGIRILLFCEIKKKLSGYYSYFNMKTGTLRFNTRPYQFPDQIDKFLKEYGIDVKKDYLIDRIEIINL